MKIAIDARFWGPRDSGLGIYTRELVRGLKDLDTSNEYFVLLRRDTELEFPLPDNFHPLIVEAAAYTLKEQVTVLRALHKLQPDLVHFPSVNMPIFYFQPFVVTIHDLIKHQSRGLATTTHHPATYWSKYFVYHVATHWIVNRAKQIFTPSQSSKRELESYFRLPPKKITVTYEAAALFAPVQIPERQRMPLPDKFAVYTGNAYPHKNLEMLISVWGEIYSQTGLELVIISGRSAFTSRIEAFIAKLSAGKYAHYLGYLFDEKLKYVYSKANLYVFPSLLEGFGLPGLDAMNFNLPVVCSDIPVLREVYGSAAYYFNPRDREDIVRKVVQVYRDNKLRTQLINSGKKQVKKYSWEKMARETLEAYQQSLGSH